MPEARTAVSDPHTQPAATERRYAWLGWLTAGLSLLFAVVIHHGVGPPPDGEARHWLEPIGFLQRDSLAFAFRSLPIALAVFGAPALIAVVVIWITSVSAVARCIGIASMFATGLFVFYGGFAPFPWEFFRSLGSATLASTAVWVGLIVSAPLLAASWRRVGPAIGTVVYVPIACAAIAFVRNATGTDPELRFAISPWPAVAIFGIEVAGSFFASVWFGVAIVLAGLRSRSGERSGIRIGRGLAAAALGLGATGAGIALAARAGLFPFAIGASTFLLAAGVLLATALFAGVTAEARDPQSLSRRARAFGLAAALIAIPLLSGEWLAQRDYDRTRNLRAQKIIDALEQYYARESLYPETLEALVASGDLDGIPEPAIGFRALDSSRFGYHDFGTSYLLEFAAPRWVECAYSPPYAEEDDYDDDEEPSEDSDLGGSWSCPAEPPELW